MNKSAVVLIALVVIVVAVFSLVSTVRGKPLRLTEFATAQKIKVVCAACGYIGDRTEGWLLNAPGGESGMKCPECGEFALRRGIVCPGCGATIAASFPASPGASGESFNPECPKCGRDLTI